MATTTTTPTNFSKIFILDKYFTSLYKFWETEKKLKGMANSCQQQDPSEEVNLAQELKQLRSKLVTLGQIIPKEFPSGGLNNGNHLNGNLNGVGVYVNQGFSTNVTNSTGVKADISVSSSKSTTTVSEYSTIQQNIQLSEIEDLIHIPGALTEDALIRCIQSRCKDGRNYVSMGQILLTFNPFTTPSQIKSQSNQSTFQNTNSSKVVPFAKIVSEAHRLQIDTNYPQTIILSGGSGSGKSYNSIEIVKQIFEQAGGGINTDAYKHLKANLTVLKSLGQASTASNSDSSRVGHFIEAQITTGHVFRTRVHCYFLDTTRVVKKIYEEKNYHIFYEMMAGLSLEERNKLHLSSHTISTLRYLSTEIYLDEMGDAVKFLHWKESLALLGIPFFDVVRVLAAILLLGNVEFTSPANSEDSDVDVQDITDLQSASLLLGVSVTALRNGLTTRTTTARNQLIRSKCDCTISNNSRDSLAKSLYCRTLATIVRRANSIKKSNGTLSTDSADSVKLEILSRSTAGTAGSKASMAILNNAVRHTTDSFIGVLDMFGFENVKPSRLEHLCINLCSETMQHFYNTHIFKSSIESCIDEGINLNMEIDYIDNVPCIDLISSLKTGLLSMLDYEQVSTPPESYINKIKTVHKNNSRLISSNGNFFTIQHFAGRVTYDSSGFAETNRDILHDDLVAVFHKHRCSFGFASHLYSSELKVLGAGGVEPCPKGILFRISPTSSSGANSNAGEPSNLTQDFHTRLDNLLRTLVHSRPHFIRCIKLNSINQPNIIDRHTISSQLRSFQVLETVNLFVLGFPHRIRFKSFMQRYRALYLKGDNCSGILENLKIKKTSWAIGSKHIFMSESSRQLLESLRYNVRTKSAVIIQSTWRGWNSRKIWRYTTKIKFSDINKYAQSSNPIELFQTNLNMASAPMTMIAANTAISTAQETNNNIRPPRPQPITYPPPELLDDKIQSTAELFGLDVTTPPQVPASRPYVISGNKKYIYPQRRLMKCNWPDDSSSAPSTSSISLRLLKGQFVKVLGVSPNKRGHIIIENSKLINIPFQYLEVID